jgi:hypothetical protein
MSSGNPGSENFPAETERHKMDTCCRKSPAVEKEDAIAVGFFESSFFRSEKEKVNLKTYDVTEWQSPTPLRPRGQFFKRGLGANFAPMRR